MTIFFSKSNYEGGGELKAPKNLTTWFIDDPKFCLFADTQQKGHGMGNLLSKLVLGNDHFI